MTTQTSEQTVHHIWLLGVRIQASFQGHSIPQWLANSLSERFKGSTRVSHSEVETILRAEFPRGGSNEIHALAGTMTRALRRAHERLQPRMATAQDGPRGELQGELQGDAHYERDGAWNGRDTEHAVIAAERPRA